MRHVDAAAARRGEWFKSSRSNDGTNCVEIKISDQSVSIRDSKYLRDPANDPRAQPVISVPVELWSQVLDLALSAGSGTVGGALAIVVEDDGSASVRSGEVTLVYTADEWDAFVKGVADGEFTDA